MDYANSFSIPVDKDLVIEVEYDMTEGNPYPFVVRLIGRVEGRKECLSRFDSAHMEEPPHRDVLGRRQGLRGKVIYENLPYCDVISYAIVEYKNHGRRYYEEFLFH